MFYPFSVLLEKTLFIFVEVSINNVGWRVNDSHFNIIIFAFCASYQRVG